MDFLERDLEDIIFNADKNKLYEKGLNINGTLKRQLKIGNYGICDLVELKRPYYHTAFDALIKGTITIYELKQNHINVGSFLQALRYLKGVKNYLINRDMESYYNYEIVLIGKTLRTDDGLVYLNSFLPQEQEVSIGDESMFNLRLYTYKYDIDGISFESHDGYRLINQGF